MLKESLLDGRAERAPSGLEGESISPELVREELRRIIISRHFRTSRRGKEFLEYVVDQKIKGKGDLLKERLIGVHLFGRKPDYATGEDPVVRVQAGDVRRRLESYHADPDIESELLIEIPVGSYAPVFLPKGSLHPQKVLHDAPKQPAFLEPEAPVAVDPKEKAPGPVTLEPANAPLDLPPAPPAMEASDDYRETPEVASGKQVAGRGRFWRLGLAAVALIVLVAALAAIALYRSPERTLKAFWLPASASPKPVLICLPRAVVYRPSEKLYDQYAETHPNTFTTREERRDHVLPLPPTTPIQWSDMTQDRSAGTSVGAVVAAVNIGKLLAEQGIRFELRFGEEASYAEMRDSPVVLVGAINTEWLTQLTAESDSFSTSPAARPTFTRTSVRKGFGRWKKATDRSRRIMV